MPIVEISKQEIADRLTFVPTEIQLSYAYILYHDLARFNPSLPCDGTSRFDADDNMIMIQLSKGRDIFISPDGKCFIERREKLTECKMEDVEENL